MKPVLILIIVCLLSNCGTAQVVSRQLAPAQRPLANDQLVPQRVPTNPAIAAGQPRLINPLTDGKRATMRKGIPVRIKDITTIQGHRSNQVTGIGIVTGLKGTGGKSKLTRDTIANMLQKFDILIENPAAGSVAVVAVTCDVPPFVRPGENIPATVSVIDDTSSLYGGVLQMATLKGIDGRAYATSFGPITLSGFSASGAGASVTKNHDTTGRVDAQVQVEINNEPAFPSDRFNLLLMNKDYATAARIADQINRYFPRHAEAIDPGTVRVRFPRQFQQHKLPFVVRVNEMTVVPDIPARVVINQKTGTIVVGQNVKLVNVAFASENLIISTVETPVASQPLPFSGGTTEVLPRTRVDATETGGRFSLLQSQTTVGELSFVLNQLGVGPRDLIGIFQELRASGALQAHLIIQ